MKQLSDEAIKELEKQKYGVVGSHSSVKICGWTKKTLKEEGVCYKQKFYGIKTHQCMQMTTSHSCANRCTFCWRGYKSPVSKDWIWETDDPIEILNQCIQQNAKLLVGIKGFKGTNQQLFEESKQIKHIALSLTGEPIIYPKINELIEECNKRGISTFLVTNAQYPEEIKNLKPVTQLYLSIDASTPEQLKDVDNPIFKDYWERLNKCLEYTAEKKQRTCIRLTIVKGLNTETPAEYAKLIQKADADFVEVKGYMFVGASRQRFDIKAMPFHEDIVEYSKELAKHLPGYEIVSEQIESRVVMLAKKEYFINNEWYTWIDFDKWNKLVNSGEDFSSLDYSIKTPETGISGKGTRDRMMPEVEE